MDNLRFLILTIFKISNLYIKEVKFTFKLQNIYSYWFKIKNRINYILENLIYINLTYVQYNYLFKSIKSSRTLSWIQIKEEYVWQSPISNLNNKLQIFTLAIMKEMISN